MKVLYIEDEPILARVFQKKLEKEGSAQLVVATDGEEGLRVAGELHPDLILLDLILPKMSGFDVLKNLKATPKLAKIPVVILSALSQSEDIKKAQDLGAAEYLVKTQHSVTEVIERILSYRTK